MEQTLANQLFAVTFCKYIWNAGFARGFLKNLWLIWYNRVQTGQVDERTIQKYEKEAKENNRGSWFFAYIMDINDEERAKVQ